MAAVAAAAVVSGAGIYGGTYTDTTPDSTSPGEVVSMRTEYSETFTTSTPGLYLLKTYSVPIHYKAEGDTAWSRIETEITDKAILKELIAEITSDRTKEVQAGPYAAEFYDDQMWNYKFARNDASIAYEAIFDTTGMQIEVTPNTRGVKERIILSEKAATTLSWRLVIDGGTIRESGNGGWVIINYSEGKEAFVIEPITAIDAKNRDVPVKATVLNDTLTAINLIS